jgi:hypothetical protein
LQHLQTSCSFNPKKRSKGLLTTCSPNPKERSKRLLTTCSPNPKERSKRLLTTCSPNQRKGARGYSLPALYSPPALQIKGKEQEATHYLLF